MVNEEEILFKGNPEIVYPKPNGRKLSFKCFKCPSIFDRKESLLTHSSLHGANKSFRCHVCDYSVNSSELLSKHMSKHRTQTNIAKPLQKLGRGKSLTKNVDIGKPSLPAFSPVKDEVVEFKCTECPASYPRPGDLRLHMHNHGSLQTNKCHLCSYASRRKDLLQKHLLVHEIAAVEPVTDLLSFKCPNCPAKFRYQRDYSRHVEKHSTDATYGCPSCTFSTHRQDSLDAHLLLHKAELGIDIKVSLAKESPREESPQTSAGEEVVKHQREPVFIKKGSRRSRFACKKCPHKAQSRLDLEKHRRAHGAQRAHTCSHCDYSAMSRQLKFNHELLHQKDVNIMASKIVHKIYKSKASRKVGTGKVDSNESTALTLTQEEYEKFRRGNPKFSYKPVKKQNRHGKLSSVSCFKCLKCPYRSVEYSIYVAHMGYHDGIKRQYSCHICDYSVDGEKKIKNHLHSHKESDEAMGLTQSSNSMRSNGRATKKNAVNSRPRKRTNQQSQDQAFKNEPIPWKSEPMGITTKSFKEAYSTEPFDAQQTDCSKYLVERMKVRNFMSLENFDLPTTNILTFQGVGKSASLAALLVGLGYDVLLHDYIPNSLCGINVNNFVREGYNESVVELKLSLHSSAKLQREYGSHLKLVRKLHRGVPLPFTSFEVSSADARERFPTHVEPIRKQRLRKILKHLNILPQFFRLILIDEENFSHVLGHSGSWYDFYEVTYESREAKIRARLEMLTLKFKRLQGEIRWRKLKEDFLVEQLSQFTEMSCRERDEAEKKELDKELSQFSERGDALEDALNSYQSDLNKLSKTMTGRLKFRYQEFLHRQNFVGSIFVDEREKSLGIWIAEASFKDVPPCTVEDAMAIWGNTPNKNQRIAVIGLFFALIDIAESPIFFIDAASTRDTEFSLPRTSLPLLFELIEKKCSQGHQFVASLPEDHEN